MRAVVQRVSEGGVSIPKENYYAEIKKSSTLTSSFMRPIVL